VSILAECLAFLANLLSLIIFGILFQEITKNKLSVMDIRFMNDYVNCRLKQSTHLHKLLAFMKKEGQNVG
jgi:hypothetical protein